MNKFLAATLAAFIWCSVAAAQNYNIAWFTVNGITTNDTTFSHTIGPFEGKLVSIEFLPSSNMCIGVYVTNIAYGTERTVMVDTTGVVSGIQFTNLSATVYLARDHLQIRAKNMVNASDDTGTLKGCVIIQE